MKESRDSRDVFAVFKADSFMKDATFGEKLRYWFKNVYWYHFRVATLSVILAVIFAVTFISDVFFKEYNSLDYVVGGAVVGTTQDMRAISDEFSAMITPKGAEENSKVGYQMLCTQSIMGTGVNGEAFDEGAQANIEKITVTMADDEVLLFFFDKKYIEWYAEQGAFEPLSSFGIESENEYFVRVDDTEFFKKYSLIDQNGIYAGIKLKTEGRMKNERITEKYENAAHVLSGILAK